MNVDWPTVFTGMKVVLDPLAAASWPLALSTVLFGFRKPIVGLIGRMKEATGFGTSLAFEAERGAIAHQQETSDRDVSVPATIASAQPPASDSVYDIFDKRTLDTLDAALPGEHSIKLLWAIRFASISETNRLHEFYYRLIFGSQIRALVALNQTVQGDVSLFEEFFNQTVADPANTLIHKGRTFEQWGEFLVNAGYVELLADTDPRVVRITPFGRQFCAWLGYAGASQAKPG